MSISPLAAHGAVGVVGGQHPEGGPQPLAGGCLEARLDAAVGDVQLAGRVDAPGGVGMPVSGVLLAGRDDKHAAGHGDVGGLVALQLVVAPAGDALGGAVARSDVPLGSIQRGTARTRPTRRVPSLRAQACWSPRRRRRRERRCRRCSRPWGSMASRIHLVVGTRMPSASLRLAARAWVRGRPRPQS